MNHDWQRELMQICGGTVSTGAALTG